MDYLVFSAVAHFALLMFNFSYDIACQWHKKLWSRMSTMPERIRMNPESSTVRFFVPKFHLKAHVQTCQTAFSFNFTRWVGRTDGEAPERGWAIFNRVASSTKEMGPGARRDILDDFYGDSNWKKRVAFGTHHPHVNPQAQTESKVVVGKTMLRKVTEALKMSSAHRHELHELESTIEPSQLKNWLDEVQEWEEDNKRSNPFESKLTRTSRFNVHLPVGHVCLYAI